MCEAFEPGDLYDTEGGPLSGPKLDSKSGEGARTEHMIARRHLLSES